MNKEELKKEIEKESNCESLDIKNIIEYIKKQQDIIHPAVSVS